MQELTLTDPVNIAIIGTAALVAGFVRGFTGFGGPAVMILSLLPFYSPLSLLPKVLTIDFMANAKLLPSTVKEVDWRVAASIVLGSLAGLPLGTYVLLVADPLIMKRAISAVALACTLVMMLGWRFKRVPPLWAHVLAGLFGGMTLGATFIAFVMMMFLFASPADSAVSRANAIFWGFMTSIALIATHLLSGALSVDEMWRAALIGLVYLAGTNVGSAMFRRTTERNFRTALLTLMAVLAATGLVV